MDKFNESLKKVNEELEQRDLLVLKFLLQGCLPSKVLEEIHSGTELFAALEKKQLLSNDNHQLLIECLNQAERIDLMKVMGWSSKDLTHAIHKNRSLLSSFRVMLHKVTEEMINADVLRLKGVLKDVHMLSPKQLEEADIYSIFVLMERKKKIHEGNVDELIRVLQRLDNIGPAGIAMEYKDKYCQASSADESLDSTVYLPSLSKGIPAYRIESLPRGYCLVIDNEDFKPASRKIDDERHVPVEYEDNGIDFHSFNIALKRRSGSSVDAEQVESTFKQLGFIVEKHHNLTAPNMIQVFSAFADRDHSKFDVFACFILSHGKQELVYGTDCHGIKIQDILHFFHANKCHTLKGKPKLFFIQACQGTEQGEGVLDENSSLQLDGIVGASSSIRSQRGQQKGLACAAKLPTEADFLIGLATLPGYVSLRSKKRGTWYIGELCRILKKHSDTVDLVSIMTLVNQGVSKKDGGSSVQLSAVKQMPLPIHTLRKRVYLKNHTHN